MEKRTPEEVLETVYRIEELQEQLLDIVDQLDEIARGLDDENARMTIVANLRCLISDDHGYLDRSYNISSWLRDLQEEEGSDD